jgi:hypothetical protein
MNNLTSITTCPKCNAGNDPGEKRCGRCGASLVQGAVSTKPTGKKLENHIYFYDGRRHLRWARDKELAAVNLAEEKKIDLEESRKVIDLCYRTNLKEYLNKGFLYLFGGLALVALVIGIMIISPRGNLYFVLLGIGVLSIAQGIYRIITANGIN